MMTISCYIFTYSITPYIAKGTLFIFSFEYEMLTIYPSLLHFTF